MSTEIKNTLFRFVTMRAPEFLETDTVDQNFVKHPFSNPEYTGEITSVFLDSVTNVPTGKTKALSLAEAAADFEPFIAERDQLHKSGLVSKKFYDFAVWLTANRTRLTMEEAVNTIITKNIDGIENEEHINDLWENLFFQIITSKSPYVREMILSLLVTDFFINNHTMIPQTDEAFQKLAQARVIIPKVLFEKEDITSKKEWVKQTLEALPVKTKELDKELDILLYNEKIESYKSMVGELKKAKENYSKRNQKSIKEARKDYDLMVSDLYANAETIDVVIVDPITNIEKTVTEYVNLIIPPFEFENQPELSFLTGKTTDTTGPVAYLNELIYANEYETLDDLIGHLENEISIETGNIFDNTDLTQPMVSANGVILPATNVPVAEPNIFSVGGNYTSGLIPMTLVFSGETAGVDVVSANYTLTFDDETTITKTSFVDTLTNNRLSVKIFTEGVNLFDQSNMELKGKFTLSDGRKINFSGSLSLFESPFSLGINKIVGDGLPTYLLRGKGAYEMLLIELDPDAADDVSNPPADGSLIRYIPSGFGIKRLGIADYRKVEQEVCCYVPGEVSHVENVMASEYKEKSTRRLRRTEDTTTSSREQEIEKLTDTTSTDRFEMNQEVSAVLAEDTHFGANVSAEQSWGTGSINAAADFANNTSTEESNSQAVTHAKEVTERALDRVVQKVKEERISKIIEEFEENSKHGYDNRKNTQHVSGVYRWIDKIYRNKVVNYGKRLMYEFMIPEPAAFHNLAISSRQEEFGYEKLIKPIDPRTYDKPYLALKDYAEITYDKAKHWAAAFNTEIEPCPSQTISVGKAFSQSKNDISSGYTHAEDDLIEIPKGYYSKQVVLHLNGVSSFGLLNGLGLGNHELSAGGQKEGSTASKRTTYDVGKFTGQIPVTYKAIASHASSGTVEVLCELSPEGKQQWQIDTFNAIIKAYENEMEKYRAKLAQQREMQAEKARTNPLYFRQIENMVLRKNCIEYLASHTALGEVNLIKNKLINDLQVDYENPLLESYAAKVKFFEQAFEWNLMSYNFYPFYWADKGKWADLYNISETDDPVFRAFLQSGMARVIVTARPGFEEAVNWYMATGQIWNGGQVPTMDDPLFVSIVQELRETEGEVEETWESRVPTSLTIIQAGSVGLEVIQALPCDEDCADYKLFDSDGQPVLDGNGNQISTNPFTHSTDVKLQGTDNVPDEGEQTPPIYNPGDEEPPVES